MVAASLLSCWNVDVALDIALEHSPVVAMPVTLLAMQLMFAEVDREHAASDRIDLEEPVLLVEVEGDYRAPGGRLLVDGRHRVWRALRDNLRELPALVVPRAMADECRMTPEDALARGWPR